MILLQGDVHPDSEFPVHSCLQRCLTAGVSHRMVSFRQESDVYRDELVALRAGHGIVENPLSYCFYVKRPRTFNKKILRAYLLVKGVLL